VTNAACFDLQVYEALEALPGDFRPLFAKAGRQSVFHTWTWYANFVESVLPPGGRLRIYTLRSSGQPRAALVTQHAAPRPFSVRKLMSLSNYYSSLFGPVVDPDDPELESLVAALAGAIARDRWRWDEIYLNPLATEAQGFEALLRALRRQGFLVDRFFSFGNWYVPVGSQTFEQFVQGRPRTGARQRKKLLPSPRFRFSLVTRPQDVEPAMADYERVYRSSWKTGEPYPGFMPGLARRCAEQGWLRLGIAYLDGEPAAAQLWIVADGTASIFKVAYDQRFAKESVGTLLTSLLMEHVMDRDKVAVVDYLTGDDSYKKDWMSHRRERWGIVAFNPRTVRGLLCAARHFGGRAARRLRQRLMPSASAPANPK
jgi:CelD/BcsL family acetyltransferase involved in cellulose biosynthesis